MLRVGGTGAAQQRCDAGQAAKLGVTLAAVAADHTTPVTLEAAAEPATSMYSVACTLGPQQLAYSVPAPAKGGDRLCDAQ
jgi:hypothetical protein